PTRDLEVVGPTGRGVVDEFVGQTVIDALMAMPDFLTLGSPLKAVALGSTPSRPQFGDLEGEPHNNVYGIVGGGNGNMSRVAVATSVQGSVWVPAIPTVAATVPAELRERLGKFPGNPEVRRPVTFRLKVEGFQEPPKEAVGVRVFLNCDYVSPTTKVGDPHYVGTFSFFGDHGDGAAHEPGDTSFYLDATKCVRRLYGGRGY